MSGLELLHRLRDGGDLLPAIMITGNSDVPMAVEAMKAGASDFIEKPIGGTELLASVAQALEQSRDAEQGAAWRESAASHIAGLTPRQRQIMDLVLAGHPEQEHRRRPRHQPAHGRKPPRPDHEKDRLEVAAGTGAAGTGGD